MKKNAHEILKGDRTRHLKIFLVLFFSLLLTAILSLYIGRYRDNSGQTLKLLFSKLLPLKKTWEDTFETVIFKIRLPRIIAAIMVGGSLSVAGTAYQSVFKNPLVSPDILGASSGAAFGAALSIYLDLNATLVQTISFCFSIGAVFFAYMIGKKIKRDATLSLILAGILVGSLNSALVSLLKFTADPNNKLPAITFWLLGSLSTIKMGDLKYIWIPMLIGLVPLLFLRWKINVLSIGDTDAKALGINLKMVRAEVIFCATLLTAAAVSVSGLVGWVGLVVPNLCRQITGSDNRILIPSSAMLGAIFLLVVDNVARSLCLLEIPLGVLTAILGAPFFAVLAISRGEKL